MKRSRKLAAAPFLCLAGLLLLAGCAGIAAPAPACSGEAWAATQLYFGRDIPTGGTVGEEDWLAFVDQEIAPRYPAGFSVTDGTGYWRDSVTGEALREANKVLMILHPGAARDEAALDEISRAYIARFDQQAVLRVDRASCVRFYEGKAAE